MDGLLFHQFGNYVCMALWQKLLHVRGQYKAKAKQGSQSQIQKSVGNGKDSTEDDVLDWDVTNSNSARGINSDFEMELGANEFVNFEMELGAICRATLDYAEGEHVRTQGLSTANLFFRSLLKEYVRGGPGGKGAGKGHAHGHGQGGLGGMGGMGGLGTSISPLLAAPIHDASSFSDPSFDAIEYILGYAEQHAQSAHGGSGWGHQNSRAASTWAADGDQSSGKYLGLAAANLYQSCVSR